MSRRRCIPIVLAALLVVGGGVVLASVAPPADVPEPVAAAEALSQAAQWASGQVMPSVVDISVERKVTVAADGEALILDDQGVRRPLPPERLPSGPRPVYAQRMIRHGTGIVVRADGIVVTCGDVVADAERITVRLADGRSLEAALMGSDRRLDIAVLNVEATDLPAATLGDSDSLHLAQLVLAIGSSAGQGNSVSLGVISGLHRRLDAQRGEDLIQTDAVLGPGSGGGPLVTLRGEVVGICMAVARGPGENSGFGLALPVNTVRRVLDDLMAGRQIARGYLGLAVQDLGPDEAIAYDFKGEGGALVAGVTPDSAAAEAGFRGGDIVTEFNGAPVRSATELSRTVAAEKPGTEVKVKVWRDGADLELTAVLGELK
jgi:serine protease Do